MTVSAVEARTHLGELISRVLLKGEDITIERAGKSVARLVAVEPESPPVGAEGKLLFSSARGLGAELWHSINIEEYVAAERGAWE